MRVDIAPPGEGASSRRWKRLARVALAILLMLVGAVAGAALAGGSPDLPRQKLHAAWHLAQTWLGVGDGAGLPVLALDVKFKHVQDLRDRRDAWIRRGYRSAMDKDAVGAAAHIGSVHQDIGIALTGSAADRGPGQLGRLRITVRGEGDLLGLRRFVIDDPQRPGFDQEALFYAALERAGLIAPRLRAVQLEVNGASWGPAVLVEQPSADHVAAHGRPEGVLVGWDSPVVPGQDADAVSWLDPRPLEPKMEGDPRRYVDTPLADQGALALSLLRDLMRGKLGADKVVDVERTARYLALCEVWGVSEGLQWGAARWLLHPLTLRLEPFVRLTPRTGRVVDGLAMAEALLQSPLLRSRYEQALHEQADAILSPVVAAALAARVHDQLPALALGPPGTWAASVQARQVRDAQNLHLGAPVGAASVAVPLADAAQLAVVLPFARVDDAARSIEIGAGTWDVAATAQLPEGYHLIVRAGAVLRFAPEAWLIVRGDCDLLGSAAAPVVLTGAVPSAAPWGGIEVIGGQDSRWSHVEVRDAAGAGVGAWQPGAAVVWVDCGIRVDHATFAAPGGAVAGVRAMGGAVHLSESSWTGSAQSGLQLGACKAELQDLRFDHIGGDAVDVLGGNAQVSRLIVRDAGGSALRAGASAQVSAQGIDADHVASGLVARDGGQLRVAASHIAGVRHLGLLAYNGASGQRAARLEARSVRIEGSRQMHLCTGGARVDIDGRAQDCSAVSVEQLVAAGIARR